jgi:hypothetical protein
VSDWLYPLSSTAGRIFIDVSGRETPVTFESFRKQIVGGVIKDDDWYLSTNYLQVQRGDAIWIYMGDHGLGIVGRAKARDVYQHSSGEWRLLLRIDRRASEALCERPFDAGKVRRHVPFPRRAVVGLDPHPALVADLHRWLREEPGRSRLRLKKLGLKPRRMASTPGRGASPMHLAHDEILGPIATMLTAEGFGVGVPSTGRLRADLVGERQDVTVMVEAKTITKQSARTEARQAFGQLHDYSLLLEDLGVPMSEQIYWAAFDQRPPTDVVRFLEHFEVLVSWSSAAGFTWSPSSKERFEAWT